MEAKFSELKFEFKEALENKYSTYNCELGINDDKFTAPYKTLIKLQCLEINANTVLNISLVKGEQTAGSLQISFITLFGEGLQGKIDRWFKLKSDVNPKLQIKIYSALNLPEKTIRRVPSFTSSVRSREGLVKCPYLESINDEKKALNDVLSRRPQNENDIKISFEPDNASLGGLEIPNLEDLNLEKLRSMGGTQLKVTVKYLCDEILKLESISQILPGLKQDLAQKIEVRRETEENSSKVLEKIKENWMKERINFLELLETRKNQKISLMEKQEQLRKCVHERDTLKGSLSDLNKEKFYLNSQKKQFEDCENSKNEIKELLVKNEDNKRKVKEMVRKGEEGVKLSLMKSSSEIEEVNFINAGLKERIGTVQGEYKAALSENQNLKKHLNTLRNKLDSVEKLSKDLEDAKNDLDNELNSRETLGSSVKSFYEKLKNNSDFIESKFQDLRKQKQLLSFDYSELFKSSESLENDILNLQKVIFDEKAQNISNEQQRVNLNDLSKLNSDLKIFQEFHKDSLKSSKESLFSGSQILSEESAKLFSIASKLDEKIENIEKKEEEIENLKSNMGQVQKRHIIHIPAKGDPLDLVLGEYINSREVPVRFLRQDCGNYLFGSMKVLIKLENNKILVKVKGGFVGIDDFLNIYLPIEVERAVSPAGVRMKRGRSPEIGKFKDSDSVKSPSKF